MSYRANITLTVAVILAFVTGSALIPSCKDGDRSEDKGPHGTENTYVGDQACKSCHSAEFEGWMDSHHYQAMLPADNSTVRGDFNDASLEADGVTSTFFRKNGKYFINTRGPEGDNLDYEIKYVFGYEPLQQYLVEFPGGRLQVTRQSWDTENKKWFHQYPGDEIHHSDWLDWSKGAQTWNTMCADCHSTDLKKGYDFNSDSFNTTWASVNVSCESCHGPGSMHVSLMESGDHETDSYRSSFVFGIDDTSNVAEIHACAPCHSRRSLLGGEFMLTGNYYDNHIPQILRPPYYHPDGQVLEEDYVFGSFAQSKMYNNYVRCTDCHDPHSMKLKLNGNLLCMQCHSPDYDEPSHHFHQKGTESAECVSCHMPSKYYMVNDLRRDHSFRIPRPDQSAVYKTPNACNDCHNDQTADWAASYIAQWYGTERRYHFSDDLLPGSLLDENSADHLISLLGRDSVPAIVKATALYYLGLADPSNTGFIAGFLLDDSPLVRKYALEALMNNTSGTWLNFALPLLSDETRIVRIAAYELLLGVADRIPSEHQSSFNKAKIEYETYLDHQLDFPAGRAAKGMYLHRTSDYSGARFHYESAIAADSMIPGVRTNLSLIYGALGENDLAKEILKEAIKLNPENGNAHYNLALLYSETGPLDSAAFYFKNSIRFIDYHPRLYYNYGLVLEKQGKNSEAEAAFLKGLELYPNSVEINYALAVFYLNNNQPEKADPYVDSLMLLQPGNEDFRKLKQMTSGT